MPRNGKELISSALSTDTLRSTSEWRARVGWRRSSTPGPSSTSRRCTASCHRGRPGSPVPIAVQSVSRVVLSVVIILFASVFPTNSKEFNQSRERTKDKHTSGRTCPAAPTPPVVSLRAATGRAPAGRYMRRAWVHYFKRISFSRLYRASLSGSPCRQRQCRMTLSPSSTGRRAWRRWSKTRSGPTSGRGRRCAACS